MNNLVNKITLYDIISMTIPGFLILLGICSLIPKEIETFLKGVNNDWFVFALIIVISYCIGWILSELMKSVYHIINMIQKKKEKDLDVEYITLVKKCYEDLKEIYKDQINLLSKDDNEITSIVENFSNSAYFLIQTDPKYGRLHNYNSSKSFSKNLSGVCLFLIIIFICHLEMTFNNIVCMIGIFFSIFGFMMMKNRYAFFSNRLKFLIITYYIDYLEHNKRSLKDDTKEGRE